MATVRRFGSFKIAIYPDDHAPPHFHVEGKGFKVVVDIRTLRVIKGDARKAGEAMDWARTRTALLLTEWNRLNRRG